MNLVLSVKVGLSPGDFVLDGDPAPLSKGGGAPSPIFGPFLLWPNGWMYQDATWYGCIPQPRGLCVRWSPSPPPHKWGGGLKFSALVYCGQTAGWIKMALGMEVSLSLGAFVLDGDPALSPKGGRAPSQIFGPFILWPNGWMHQDAIWYGGRPQPRGLSVRWGPSPSPKRGRSPSPILGPCLLRSNGCTDQDGTWYGGRPWPRRHCVRWGPSSPSPKKGAEPPPQFSAHVYCGQTAGWIKMALGMEWASVQATLC